MYIWMNKTTSITLPIPCVILPVKTSHPERVTILAFRRQGKGVERITKTILRYNLYTLPDFLKVRSTVAHSSNKKAYNKRLNIALESARINGEITRV